jgi:hypothetical protein
MLRRAAKHDEQRKQDGVILEYTKSVRIGQLQYFSQIPEDRAVRPWRTAGEQVLSLNQ